jgi:hypothetical protein
MPATAGRTDRQPFRSVLAMGLLRMKVDLTDGHSLGTVKGSLSFLTILVGTYPLYRSFACKG